MFEFAPDGFYLNDLEGNFIDGNKVAQEIIGYKKEELVGSSFLKLGVLPPEEIPKAAELLIENFNGRATGPDEFILNRKDGTPVVVEIMTLPVTIKSQKVVLAVARDISERKQAEEERKKLEAQLQQAQKMEAIGTLAGGIAHDFNNILAAIIGYAEIASLQVAEDDKAKESLKEVLKAGLRAKNLVKQILAFSRKSEQERIPMQISPIVKEALKLLRSSLPTTIEIRQNIESDTGIVEADPTQIHQILMNLCTNAGHAMGEEGGVLEVTLTNVDIDARTIRQYPDMSPGPYLRLSVSD
ncbi:MAG: PAS domain S-box protein, partial [Deltaproteobacteria bacterium]|nr:PAS domain S-box protein [Deltaproteobacteria bacterium]